MQNNPLTNKFAEYIQIQDKKLKLNTDYRVWVDISGKMQDINPFLQSEAEQLERVLEICDLAIGQEYEFSNEVFIKVVEFLINDKVKQESGGGKAKKKDFDFTFDGESIYSSFMVQYGIDLQTVDMHWHKFKALFDGLGERTPFVQRIKLRNLDISTIEKKHQAEARKAQASVALPKENIELDICNALESI